MGDEAQTYRALWPYQEAFHEYTDLLPGTIAVNEYGVHPYKSPTLVRNVQLMPAVFCPSIQLVVTEAVAERLRELGGVDVVPCKWGKAYDPPMDEKSVRQRYSDFSIFDGSYTDWLLNRLKPAPRNIEDIRYCQIVAPRLQAVAGGLRGRRPISLPFDDTDQSPETSAAVHEKHAVVRHGEYFLLSQQAWEVLEPHMHDRDAFTIALICLK